MTGVCGANIFRETNSETRRCRVSALMFCLFCHGESLAGKAAGFVSAPCLQFLRRVVHPTHFVDATVADRAFHHFVAQQCDDAPVPDQPTGLTVPANAGSPSSIVD